MNPPSDAPKPNSEPMSDWLQPVYCDGGVRTHRALLPVSPAPMTTGLSESVEDMPLDEERWWDRDRAEAFVCSLLPIQRKRVAKLRHTFGVKYRTATAAPTKAPQCGRCALTTCPVACAPLAAARRSRRWCSLQQAPADPVDAPREYARLMGAGDYDLSTARDNQVPFGFGDAVAVPAVSCLAENYENYLLPLVRGELASVTQVGKVAANG